MVGPTLSDTLDPSFLFSYTYIFVFIDPADGWKLQFTKHGINACIEGKCQTRTTPVPLGRADSENYPFSFLPPSLISFLACRWVEAAVHQARD